MMFTFLYALMLYRCGVRKCDALAMKSRKAKLLPLFFGRNQPTYKRILTLGSYIQAHIPKTLKELMNENISQSRDGNTGHYQGGDACLEELNKLGKCFISDGGVPSDPLWLKTFRNLGNLDKVRFKYN